MIYDFMNEETKEVETVSMSLSEYDEYVLNNKHMTRYFGNQTNPIGDSVRLGRTKIDNGFKEVLQKIHERTAGSTMNV